MEHLEDKSSKEIVLTEVIEPPKDSSFSSHTQSTPTTEGIQVDLPDELDILFDEEDKSGKAIEDAHVDAVIQEALTPEDSIDVSDLMSDEPSQPDTTEEPQTESIQVSSNPMQNVDLQLLKHAKTTSSEDSAHSALDKLDNLDAMIDTMITVPSSTDSTLVEKIEALAERVSILESTPPTLKGEFSLQDVYERTIYLEGQYTALSNTVNEIQDHLHALLPIPKKINDIEKQIEPLSHTTLEEHSLTVEAIEQRVQKLESSAGEIQQSLDSLQDIHSQFNDFQSQITSLEKHIPSSEFEGVITTKLEQLEQTVDTILAKQLAFEESTSIQAIHDALLPSIEKEAILAASRIIKEELQSILTWK